MENEICAHCGAKIDHPKMIYRGDQLCPDCLRAEIRAMLVDCDPEETAKLRRRIEDAMRKSPGLLIEIGAILASRQQIKIDDLI